MPFVGHIALISETPSVGFSELSRVSAALQKQVMRDLSPAWDVQGTVDAFASLEDVPAGYWPVIVRDDIGQDAEGIHCDHTGQPMALVTADMDWSITASHEVLEMLVDPLGDMRIAGPSVAGDDARVEYLVEIADPVSGKWYLVNGVKVSDFYTRHYFDPIQVDGVQYSFIGNLKGPRQVLFGGYVTWFDAIRGEWYQHSWFAGDKPSTQSLGPIQKTTCGMRPAIDRLTPGRREAARAIAALDSARFERAMLAALESSKAKAKHWRVSIDKITRKA